MKEREVIFWDFDGVIKDSVGVKTQGYVALFQPYGEVLAERVRAHHEAFGGVSRYEKIPLYLQWANESPHPEKVREFCYRFSALVQQAVIDSPWVPGVLEYLQANFRTQYFVLVTATPDDEIHFILNKLDISKYFREVYGAPMTKREAIGKVLHNLRCDKKTALVVGDSDSDFIAAAENKVDFLLRCTPVNGALQLKHTGFKCEDLRDE